MKLDWNKRYNTIAAYALLVIFCLVLCVFGFLNFGSVWKAVIGFLNVFTPIFCGVFIAYILCPSVKFFENRAFAALDKKQMYSLKRVLSVAITFILVILSVVLFCWLVIPRVLAGYADLQHMSNLYFETVKEWILGISLGEGFLAGHLSKIVEYAVSLLEKLYNSIGGLIPDIMTVATALVSIFSDLLLGIILSIYFLLARERLGAQAKKLMRAFLSTDKYRVVKKSAILADKNFGGFIKGQLADALVMGVISYFCLLIIGVPYYPLVSVLVGIASVVPVFGTLIGTIAGALIIFLADPMAAFWFVIFMVILHQINKRMIKPYVIRVGVDASTIFMFTAIILMTGLIGFWGLIIGVPVFAILYATLHSVVDRKLEKKGITTDSYEYYSTETGKALYLEREKKRMHRRRAELEKHAVTEEIPIYREPNAEILPDEQTSETEEIASK